MIEKKSEGELMESKYLEFNEIIPYPKRKTKIFEVRNSKDNFFLA